MRPAKNRVIHLDERQETLVKYLEDVLDRARSGEVRSIVFVGILAKGRIYQGFLGAWEESSYTLIGAMESVKIQMLSGVTLNVEGQDEGQDKPDS